MLYIINSFKMLPIKRGLHTCILAENVQMKYMGEGRGLRIREGVGQGAGLKGAATPKETNLHFLTAVFDSEAPGLVHRGFAVHPRH